MSNIENSINSFRYSILDGLQVPDPKKLLGSKSVVLTKEHEGHITLTIIDQPEIVRIYDEMLRFGLEMQGMQETDYSITKVKQGFKGGGEVMSLELDMADKRGKMAKALHRDPWNSVKQIFEEARSMFKSHPDAKQQLQEALRISVDTLKNFVMQDKPSRSIIRFGMSKEGPVVVFQVFGHSKRLYQSLETRFQEANRERIAAGQPPLVFQDMVQGMDIATPYYTVDMSGPEAKILAEALEFEARYQQKEYRKISGRGEEHGPTGGRQ